MPITGNHVRIGYVAMMAGLIGFIAVRQYELANVRPNIDPYINFLRSADKVQLLVTAVDLNEKGEPIVAPKAKDDLKATSKLTRVSKDDFGKVVSFVKDIVAQGRSLGHGFQPHHYIVADKGKERIQISICFSCKAARFVGINDVMVPISNPKAANTAELFGLDLDRMEPGKGNVK